MGVSLEKKAALTVTRLVDSGSGDSGPLVCDPTAKGRLGAQGGGASSRSSAPAAAQRRRRPNSAFPGRNRVGLGSRGTYTARMIYRWP